MAISSLRGGLARAWLSPSPVRRFRKRRRCFSPFSPHTSLLPAYLLAVRNTNGTQARHPCCFVHFDVIGLGTYNQPERLWELVLRFPADPGLVDLLAPHRLAVAKKPNLKRLERLKKIQPPVSAQSQNRSTRRNTRQPTPNEQAMATGKRSRTTRATETADNGPVRLENRSSFEDGRPDPPLSALDRSGSPKGVHWKSKAKVAAEMHTYGTAQRSYGGYQSLSLPQYQCWSTA